MIVRCPRDDRDTSTTYYVPSLPHPCRARRSSERDQSHLGLGASVHGPAEYYLGGVRPPPVRVSTSGIVATAGASCEYVHRVAVRSLYRSGRGVREPEVVLVVRHVDRDPGLVEGRPEDVPAGHGAVGGHGQWWQGDYRCSGGGRRGPTVAARIVFVLRLRIHVSVGALMGRRECRRGFLRCATAAPTGM